MRITRVPTNYYDFYSQYLDFHRTSINSEGFTPCKCPLHEDKEDSAGVNLVSGVFNCFVCGSFSPARFLHKILSELSFPQASAIVDEYRREHKIIKKVETFVPTRFRDPRLEKLHLKSLEYPLDDIPMVLEYAESRGLYLETLHAHKIGYLPGEFTSWGKDSIVFPYFVSGKVLGIRYRDEEGSKNGEPGCHFTLWGIDELGSDPDVSVAVLVEGESDKLRTWQELKAAGFDATVVSTPTATFKQEWTREFEGYHKVVHLPQDDAAALHMVDAASTALKERYEALWLPWRRKQVGKDVCNWLDYNPASDLALRIETIVGETARKFMTGAEFRETSSQPRHMLINGLLARRQVAILAGPQKSFKTWLMLAMARCMITGEEFAGLPDMTGKGGLKVMIIEEEGDQEEFQQRIDKVFAGVSQELIDSHLIIGHHLGVHLDEEHWVKRMEGEIEKYGIDCLMADPLQRLHSGEENSATEMGPFWNNIHRLTTRFKTLGIVLLHHFNKMGDVSLGWNALRGSSRNAGEADLGIFIQKRPASEGIGVKVKFDGRTIPYMETPDGKDVFKFTMREHGLVFDTERTVVDKRLAFVKEVQARDGWDIPAAAKFFGTSTVTIRNWIEKSDGLDTISQGSGRPALIVLVP